MQIQGKLLRHLPTLTGVSKKNETWQKDTFVIETNEQYPKKIAFDLFNKSKLADNLRKNIGKEIIAHIDIDSREFEGKWYTNIKAWKVDAVKVAHAPVEAVIGGDEEGDLPF